MRCLPILISFFAMSQLDWPIIKKMKLWRLPKIKGYFLKYRVPPFWPTYIGERRTTFVKAFGIKVRYYWEFLGEHVRSLGTLCF
jgi:hypothetical protein